MVAPNALSHLPLYIDAAEESLVAENCFTPADASFFAADATLPATLFISIRPEKQEQPQ